MRKCAKPTKSEISVERWATALGIANLSIGFVVMGWTHLLCHDCTETCVGCLNQVPYCWLPATIGFAMTFAGAYMLIRVALNLLKLRIRRWKDGK